MTKICTKCHTEKSHNEFHKQKNGKNGLRAECKACRIIEKSEYMAKNKEKIFKNNQKYREANKAELSSKKKLWYETNKSDYLDGRKKYREVNKKLIKESNKIYLKKYPEKRRAIEAKRRAKEFLCTPPWYNSQKKDIEELYKKARLLSKQTGVKHHVDHIFPLNPQNITDSVGLHVLANLQILTEVENLRKSNKQPILSHF